MISTRSISSISWTTILPKRFVTNFALKTLRYSGLLSSKVKLLSPLTTSLAPFVSSPTSTRSLSSMKWTCLSISVPLLPVTLSSACQIMPKTSLFLSSRSSMPVPASVSMPFRTRLRPIPQNLISAPTRLQHFPQEWLFLKTLVFTTLWMIVTLELSACANFRHPS